MGGQEFEGFGSSTEDYPHSYLTAACAIGLSESEMNEFFSRLDKGFKDFFAKQKKEAKKKAAALAE
jgi:O-phospho-L-seryl-tRNASec:L-selenocysteinyl-tRNA synthase